MLFAFLDNLCGRALLILWASASLWLILPNLASAEEDEIQIEISAPPMLAPLANPAQPLASGLNTQINTELQNRGGPGQQSDVSIRGGGFENNVIQIGGATLWDPQTGHYFDDTKRYVDALDITDAERHAIFEGNARRVFPRLDAQLKDRGL